MFAFPLVVVAPLAFAPLALAAAFVTPNVPADVAAARPTVEQAVLTEINRARGDPAGFARTLRDSLAFYHGDVLVRPGTGVSYLTQEGTTPVREAIAFVDGEAARPTLAPTAVLTDAAADHQAEQRADGTVGHVGRDGSTPAERLRRRGGDRYVGEVIAYGSSDPGDIVRQLVVDDGVADRGHRRLLFDGSLRYAGVSCGDHPVYRYMCVVTLARTPDGRPLRSGTMHRL